MIHTYSFEDTSFTLSHESIGEYTMYGAGLGDITISRSNDVTTHEVAADLSVLVSRSAKRNGSINVNVLQSSEANDYLNKFCKYLETCDPEEFALGSAVLMNSTTNETWICTGVTHQKMPDRVYQSEGQFITYTLMVADLSLQ